jgi:ankyrin repeat protein
MDTKNILNTLFNLNKQLFEAIRRKRSIEVIESLLNDGASSNAINGNQMTPLLYAIIQNNIPLIMILLNYGADPNFAGDGLITPPLILATRYSHFAITKLLIHRDVNINITDNSGKTALIYATIYRYGKIAALLFENGANIHISDNNGQNSLIYSQIAIQKDVHDIFYTFSNILNRKELLTYSESSKQRQLTPKNKIGMFIKVASGPRKYWIMHILGLLGNDAKNVHN